MADADEKGESEVRADDAFAGISTPRSIEQVLLKDGAQAVQSTPAPSVPKSEDQVVLEKAVPEEQRTPLVYATVWASKNIKLYKHSKTGNYLYLAVEDDGSVKAYVYQASSHNFVQVPIEEAIEKTFTDKYASERRRSQNRFRS